MHVRVAAVILICLALPSKLLACTPAPGVDQQAFYARLVRPDYEVWAVSAFAAFLWLSVGRRRAGAPRWTWWLVGLAVLQPAWWIPGTMGDCGTLRLGAGVAVALASLFLLVAAFVQTRRAAGQDHAAGV